MTIYTATIGIENVKWITGPNRPYGLTIEDGVLRSDVIDLGDGRIEISQGGVEFLRDLNDYEDGYISDDEDGMQIWIEGDGYLIR